MTRPTPFISVIIATHADERFEHLRAAVASVSGQTVAAREIIVVVDHNPGLFARVRATLDDATVLENVAAPGLSGARNTGAAAALGEIVAFLDDDAVAAPDWLDHLGAPYADPRVMAVGGRILAKWQHDRPAWFPEEFAWVVGCTYRGMPLVASPLRNLIGANMSVRRLAWKDLGGFRTDIGRNRRRLSGGEETELCIRAAQRWPQGIILYMPSALVHHHVPEARMHWRYVATRCAFEGQSKALVARYVGRRAALSSEWSFVVRTLSAGVLRGLADAILRRDITGLWRALVLLLGLAVTGVCFLLTTATLALGRGPASPSASPPLHPSACPIDHILRIKSYLTAYHAESSSPHVNPHVE